MGAQIYGRAAQDDLIWHEIGLERIAEQPEDDDAVPDRDEQQAEDAQLLDDDGQDIVAVRLGQITILPGRVAKPQPEDA